MVQQQGERWCGAAEPLARGPAAGAGGRPAALEVPPLTPELEARIEALAIAARAGNREAQAQLLEQLEPLVQGTARRVARRARRLGLELELEDLLQEARAALLQLMAWCDPRLGSPLAFFTLRLRARLAQRVQAQARRRPPGRRLAWHDDAAVVLAEALSARLYREAHDWEQSGAAAALHEALGSLSPRHKRVLFLYYWRQLGDEGVAAALAVSIPAARQLRYRALSHLRRWLGEAGYGPAQPAATSAGRAGQWRRRYRPPT